MNDSARFQWRSRAARWAGALLPLLFAANALGQAPRPLAERIQAIIDRPEYAHSRFGMKFHSLSDGRVLFEMNADEFFIPGSAAKLYPAGALLAVLGPDYRFHTKVYRTGPIVDGVLRGDLVLVASGDPNLSNRIRSDGTLAYSHPDHTYDMVPGSSALDGDPLMVIRKIADQVAARGIKRIEGRVRVDASLFRENPWGVAGPQNFVISPIMVNDNVIDVTVAPAPKEGEPANLIVSPATEYVRFVNGTKTVTGTPRVPLHWENDVINPDGSRSVTLAGEVQMDGPAVLRAYRVPEPARFAAVVLTETLRERGIEAEAELLDESRLNAPTAAYTPANLVAEHVSPPLSEAVKVALKVSHNLHSAAFPHLMGALVARNGAQANAAGFGVQRKAFESAGLDLTQISQRDGAGIDTLVTPEFTVRFLEHIWRQPYFRAFLDAQPIMGRDGSLMSVQKTSAAAGRVHAKTGTAGIANLITQSAFLSGKGLAGYIEAPDGRLVAFALYVNFVPTRDLSGMERVGEALGEIASAVYETFVEERSASPRSPVEQPDQSGS